MCVCVCVCACVCACVCVCVCGLASHRSLVPDDDDEPDHDAPPMPPNEDDKYEGVAVPRALTDHEAKGKNRKSGVTVATRVDLDALLGSFGKKAKKERRHTASEVGCVLHVAYACGSSAELSVRIEWRSMPKMNKRMSSKDYIPKRSSLRPNSPTLSFEVFY